MKKWAVFVIFLIENVAFGESWEKSEEKNNEEIKIPGKFRAIAPYLIGLQTKECFYIFNNETLLEYRLY